MYRKKKLSKRLAAVARLVEFSGVKTFCDIGTDHCYLPIYLADKCQKVIACDRLQEPLSRARQNVDLYKKANRISLRLGDGFNTIADFEVEAAVVAGMGGREISKILNARIPKGIRFFIFQPMNNYHVLRKTCVKNSLKIDREFLTEDNGRFYLTLMCSSGSEIYSNFDYLYGKFIPYDDNPVSKKYLKRELLRLQKISGVLGDSDVSEIVSRLLESLKNSSCNL